jgi:predicted N-acyltransferase
MRRQMLRELAPFLSLELYSDDEVWACLPRGSFGPHGRWTDFTLNLAADSVDEYLASLPGTNRRKIGTLLRRGEREGIAAERLQPDRHAARVRSLIHDLLDHHGTFDSYVPDLVSRAAAYLGGDLHIVGATRDGEVIACAIVLRDGDTVYPKWVGLDYERTWGTAAYLVLTFEVIRLAIELGVRIVRFGPTAETAKRGFGAVPRERSSAVSVIGPLPPRLVSAAARLAAGRAATDPTFSSAGQASQA